MQGKNRYDDMEVRQWYFAHNETCVIGMHGGLSSAEQTYSYFHNALDWTTEQQTL